MPPAQLTATSQPLHNLMGHLPQISPREFEVWSLISEGKGTRQVAESLGLSVKTVEAHKEHLKRKLGLKTSIELMPLGLRHGLARIDPLPELADLGSLKPEQRLLRVNAVLFKREWEKAGVKVDLGAAIGSPS